MRKIYAAPLVLLLVLSITGSALGDPSRVLKSAVFPGMGQLGDDQVVKGLAFMGAEVVCLTVMFSQVSKMQSYSRHTTILDIKYGMSKTYKDRKALHELWTKAYDDAQQARTNSFVLGGLAALCWGINIADALIFVPARSDESLSTTILRNTTISAGADGASVAYSFAF